jgi:type II secretory pathway pseudopilin PulG
MRSTARVAARLSGSARGAAHPLGAFAQSGLTLIEALIAMALLLLVAIGILPLFTRSILNNAAGSEATQTANNARIQLEEMTRLPFNNLSIRLAGGSELLMREVFSASDRDVLGDETWVDAGSVTGPVLYNRATRVRQFGLNAPIDANADNVLDGFEGLVDTNLDGEFDNPLADGTDPQFVHFKEVAVEVARPGNSASAGPLGRAPTYRVRSIKSF